MTDDEKQTIVDEVLTNIYQQSTEVTSLDKASSMKDMTGLPAVNTSGKLVSVPLELFSNMVESISKDELDKILS